MRSASLAAVVVVLGLLAGPLLAEEVVYKHDQFPEDIVEASVQISSTPLNVQSGYVDSEAFGQLYQPDPGDYPIQIKAIEMVLAAPPNLPETAEANATIEIWLHSGASAQPDNANPYFSIHTNDLYNPATDEYGMPLTGDTAMIISFDMQNPANHPPPITTGNFSVVVRFQDEAQSLGSEWGNDVCNISALSCGCQEIGTIHDQASTSSANLMHIALSCSGTASWWSFSNAIGVTGDTILRARADVNVCTPDCAGRECGPDPVCGQSCGDCPLGDNCGTNGLCACTPDCNDRVCGDDGCYGSCGDCPPGETCNLDGLCECVPDCVDRVCGDDACDGSCGDCPPGETCDVDGLCECVPDCVDRLCGDDGCDGSCGGCPPGENCTMDGECVGCTPDCSGQECGPDPDCNVSCGSCDPGETCNPGGQCVAGCLPDCNGRECGDDGCEGSCGTCDSGADCVEGACLQEEEVAIEAISPVSATSDKNTPVSITGQGFQAGAIVRLGGTDLIAVEVTSSELISASVPSKMAAGTYLLVVVNPDGGTASLPDAFEVIEVGSGGCGCGVASPVPAGRSAASIVLALLGLSFIARRTRRRCSA